MVEWTQKCDMYIYVCDGLSFNHGKEGNPAIWESTRGPHGPYAMINTDKYCMILFICRILK